MRLVTNLSTLGMASVYLLRGHFFPTSGLFRKGCNGMNSQVFSCFYSGIRLPDGQDASTCLLSTVVYKLGVHLYSASWELHF